MADAQIPHGVEQSSKLSSNIRRYSRESSAVFLKTKEKYGGLSNMAGGFPLEVNGIPIRTSEALYQACRFPDDIALQRIIIAQSSPMTAKMKGRPHRSRSRPDWNQKRVAIMRWCLEVKLAQNFDSFSRVLLETGSLPIVEESQRDEFWGAKPQDGGMLIGKNALGRLLMQLREQVKEAKDHGRVDNLLRVSPPPNIDEFNLLGKPIGVVDAIQSTAYRVPNESREEPPATAPTLRTEGTLLRESTAGGLSGAEELFACFAKNLYLMLDEPLKGQDIADHLKIRPGQTQEWLARMVEEGTIVKTTRPVRYARPIWVKDTGGAAAAVSELDQDRIQFGNA